MELQHYFYFNNLKNKKLRKRIFKMVNINSQVWFDYKNYGYSSTIITFYNFPNTVECPKNSRHTFYIK